MVKNKSIGGSQFTRPKRPTQRTTRYFHSQVEAEVGVVNAGAGVVNAGAGVVNAGVGVA